MVGVTWKGAKGRPSLPDLRAVSQPPNRQPQQPVQPRISFRDKEAYQELFRPLPRPEAIPTLTPVKIDTKSWLQLQEEREAIVKREIERTRLEAEDMWGRARKEDEQRLTSIRTERERLEAEYSAREQLMQREKEERESKDRARKESIRRQEQLLDPGRHQRAKTTDGEFPFPGGPGIHVYHYKDPVVMEIVKLTKQQQLQSSTNPLIGDTFQSSSSFNTFNSSSTSSNSTVNTNATSNSHTFQNGSRTCDSNGAEADTGFYSEVQQVKHIVHPGFAAANPRHVQPDFGGKIAASKQLGGGGGNTAAGKQLAGGAAAVGQNGGFNEYKSVMDGKEFWRVGMVDRSLSSASSTISR